MATISRLMILSSALAGAACTVSTQPGTPSNAAASAALKANCELQVRAVERDSRALGAQVIGPSEVAAIRPAAVYDGELAMSVELLPAGQERMLAHTSAHVGEELAVFCGANEVSRATISEPFASPFHVHVGERSGT